MIKIKDFSTSSCLVIQIKTTYNNTIISITTITGNLLKQCSSGSCGLKGSRKGTPFAAQTVVKHALTFLRDQNSQKFIIKIKGRGPNREAILRFLKTTTLNITKIMDVTPIAHNGCRPAKKRRI